MLKKMRKRAQNKKGFTLVELIVVIVIILILAAVLVPSMLKYVEKANKANCKSDAATLLSQLQADYASSQVSDVTGEDATADGKFKIGNVEIAPDTTGTATPNKDNGVYSLTDGEISRFAYNNGKYTAVWVKGTAGGTGGWTVTESGATNNG